MKLKNLGKIYTLDSENNFSIEKDIDLSQEVTNFIDIILDYFRTNESLVMHSAYLRGSCLERNKIDNDTMDIDMIIVHENDLFQPYGYFDKECTDEIIEIMKSSCGFSVYPDVRIDHINHFLEESQMRFLCKKVYGEKDLSVLKRSKSEMLDWADQKYDIWTSRLIQYIKDDKKTLDHYEIRSDIKLFFRDLSVKFMIENDEFSKSLYQCHRVMVENYPYYSDDLDDILDLFLNVEEYSREKIIEDLNKILLFVKSLRSKKPYHIKVTKR